MEMQECPVMGLREIAELLGTSTGYVGQMRIRGQRARANGVVGDENLPEEDWTVSNRPLWRRETILRWARATGRIQ